MSGKIHSDAGHPLNTLVKALEQVVQNTEDDFMSLGLELQKVQLQSSAQRQKISAAMGLFQAEGEAGLMQQISAYVEQSQQDTSAAQATATALCDDLVGMLRVMQQIDKDSHALEKAGLFLHVIGINTGIECSRYSQIESTFKVVAGDTINLAEQIRKATAILLEKSQQAGSEQKRTLQEARKNIESLEELAQNGKQATEVALSKVSELINYSISMVNEAEQMAQAISGEISKVVMGIQFHDNLRQRIEHVNEALQESAVLTADSDEELVCNTYLAVELQKAQLDTLVRELEQLYLTQSQALENIIQEVRGLEIRLARMADEQDSDRGAENPVAVLLQGIGALEELNRDSLTLGEKISVSGQRAAQIVNEMNEAIQTTFAIANSVKINALNAIIKAAKFGRAGMALQVLAQGMVTTSQNTRNLVGDFTEQIEQLRQLSSCEDHRLQLSPASDFNSQQLQQVFQNFRSELQSSQGTCRELAASLTKQKQDLVFIARLKDAIAAYAEQLSQYAADIKPENQQLLNKLRANFGEQHATRYTMHEERAIHQQIRQIAAPAAAAAVASDDIDLWGDEPTTAEPAAAAAPEIDLWDDEAATEAPAGESDDVELWGDAPSPAASAGEEIELWGEAPVEQPPSSDGSIELWDDEPETNEQENEPETEETKKPEEDFGDNVELF